MIKVRKFRKEDAGKTSYMVCKCQREVLSKEYPKKIIDYFCSVNSPAGLLRRAKKRQYYVGVEGDRILGLAGLQDGDVKTMFVNPRHHKRGVAKKIIDHITAVARKKKLKKLTVTSTYYAEGFYKKCGFKIIKRVKENYRGHMTKVIKMEKKLD